MIFVYNRAKETHSGENNYPVYIGAGILSNPYTDLKEKRHSIYYVKTFDEALERYTSYFNMMYNGNVEFRNKVDEIYEKYKAGEDVYLEDADFEENSTGLIIKKKLEQRLLKEKLKKYVKK